MPDTPTMLASAVTHVGRVRTQNEDAHFVDADAGLAIVCDGMGGHAAGEVASNLAVQTVRDHWTGPAVERARQLWLRTGTPEARRALIAAVQGGVLAANQAILDTAAQRHDTHGMGTTFTGALFVAGEAVFAHAGDSRAYLVREGIAVRLTEDHTLLARLEEAGVDVGRGEPTRWKGVVTNALGIGDPTRVSTFTVPLADGDRFVLCSDGVSEYCAEDEIGKVAVAVASPARAAQRLVELALERGGHDNATAVVVRVIEAGATPLSPAARRQDEQALAACPLLARLTPQRRLRALRIASEHAIHAGEPLPARFLGDRVAWIVLSGEASRGDRVVAGPGALLYPESLASTDAATPAGAEWIARGPVRALVLRAGDVGELARDEPDVGERLYAALSDVVRGV